MLATVNTTAALSTHPLLSDLTGVLSTLFHVDFDLHVISDPVRLGVYYTAR